jgi:serine-type D-Ala-D-Ala carboxypeptidase
VVQEVTNEAISSLLRAQVIAPRVAPAAVAGYVGTSVTARLGAAGALPEGPARTDTVFDLASVSKPVVACTLLRLVSRGRLDLAAPLGDLLVEAQGTRSADLPLELFLCHRAGLDGHRPLFAPVFAGRPFARKAALVTAANARRPDADGPPPVHGFAPVYSDLGYVLVGAVIEAATGRALDEVIAAEVIEPLGLELGSARQWHRRRPSFLREVAPTEVVRARGGVVRGIVHDENSWALAGHGASGHAGLFGTVRGVLGLGAALLEAHAGESSWLPRTALHTLVRERPGGTLRAGFDGKSGTGSSAGDSASGQSFGHLGFTGTSLWCDPVAGIATALLTNRVHPTRENARIRAARPVVHEELFRAARAGVARPP